jgi:hypothetical protein
MEPHVPVVRFQHRRPLLQPIEEHEIPPLHALPRLHIVHHCATPLAGITVSCKSNTAHSHSAILHICIEKRDHYSLASYSVQPVQPTRTSTQSTVLGINTQWTERAIEFAPQELDNWTLTKELKRMVLPGLLGQGQEPTDCRLLAFPVHRVGHWVLAVLNVQTKQFTHLDSWQRSGTVEAARKELNALQNIFNHLAGNARIPWLPHVCAPAVAQQYELEDQGRALEHRRPAGDCGLFLIAWAFATVDGNLHTVDQRSMRSVRQRIALRLLARRQEDPSD